MKLLFWPMFLYAVVQSRFFRDRKDFWCVKLRGILLGLILIPVIFYTYNGAVGRSPDWLNIAIFFVAAAGVYVYEARLFEKGRVNCERPRLALGALCLLGVLFVVFTFVTPEIGLFRDPLTGSYGI
jgi:cell division protein FtsW (lipid II flippase)